MPVLDVEDWIVESVDSILRQSISDLELVVVDDGSSDGTLNLLREIQRNDPRVRILRNQGKGAASARNAGISASRGEYLAFADGDDVVPSRAYEKLLASLDASGSEMVVGNYFVLEPQQTWSRRSSLPIYGKPRAGITIKDEPTLLRDRVCWNRLISRGAWHQAGIRFVESPRSNDIVAMVQTYCAFTFDVIVDPVYCYRRRLGPTSITASKLDPSSTIAHLTQELLCIEALERLDSDELLSVFFVGILEHDLRGNTKHLLSEPALSAPDANFPRALLQEIVMRAPDSAIDGLREWQRLIYAFVRAGKWDFAAAASSTDDFAAVQAALANSSLAEFVTAAHELTTRVNSALTKVFRTVAQPVLDDEQRRAMSDEEIVRAVESLRQAQRAGIPRARLTPLERVFIASPPDTNASALRDLRVEPADTAGLPALRLFWTSTRARLERTVRGALRRGTSFVAPLRRGSRSDRKPPYTI
jgi:hypothetical protein